MNKQIRKYLQSLLIISLLGFYVAGCSTMEGLGKDMEDLGEGIQEEASD